MLSIWVPFIVSSSENYSADVQTISVMLVVVISFSLSSITRKSFFLFLFSLLFFGHRRWNDCEWDKYCNTTQNCVVYRTLTGSALHISIAVRHMSKNSTNFLATKHRTVQSNWNRKPCAHWAASFQSIKIILNESSDCIFFSEKSMRDSQSSIHDQLLRCCNEHSRVWSTKSMPTFEIYTYTNHGITTTQL